MHPLQLILYLIVAGWLLPGAIISDTALVLLVAWGIGEVAFYATGEYVPQPLYALSDAVSVLLILRWATGRDWLILAIYPAMWVAYVAMDGREQWLMLYVLFLAQAIIAGPWVAFSHNRTKEFRRGFTGQPLGTKGG